MPARAEGWRERRLLLGNWLARALHWPLIGPLLAEGIALAVARGCEVESREQGFAKTKHPAVLAITWERFRGDLNSLAASNRLGVVLFSRSWHGRINSMFWTPAMGDAYDLNRHYYSEGRPAWLRERQARYRAFLEAVLPRVCRRVGAMGVISPSVWYFHAYEIGAVAQENGLPFVVLHREGLITVKGHREGLLQLFRSLGRFRGSLIILHNEVVRDLIRQSGYADEAHTKALGATRMDQYLARVANTTPDRIPRKQVTLFSFLPGSGRVETGNPDFGGWPAPTEPGLHLLFRSSHAVIARLAREFPEVRFVIKPKWRQKWFQYIDDGLALEGIDRREIPNLEILPEANAHDLILGSSVVCGFASTVLLEAGIAGKPVIVPMYAEAAASDYQQYVYFSEDAAMFDNASSEAHFAELIRRRLDDSVVSDAMMAARRAAFAKYLSPLDGKASERYADAVLAAVTGSASRAGAGRV